MYENEWVNPSNRISYNEGGDGIKLARQIYKNTQKKSFDKIIKYTSI